MSGTVAPRVVDGATASDRYNLALRHPGPEPLLVRNYVFADLAPSDPTLDAKDDYTLEGAKRGKIATGMGGDVVRVAAWSNGGGAGNQFDIDLGAGGDRLEFVGAKGRSTGTVLLGDGTDVAVVQGMASATIRGEGGNDFLELPGGIDGRYAFHGGDGYDVVTLFMRPDQVRVQRTGDGAATITVVGTEHMFAWQRPQLVLTDVERIRFAPDPAPVPGPLANGTTYAPGSPGPVTSTGTVLPTSSTGVTWVDLRAAPEAARPTAAHPGENWWMDTSGAWRVQRGTYGNDGLLGGIGDTLAGGEGDDTYYYHHYGFIVEKPGEGVDWVRSFVDQELKLAPNVENGTVYAADRPSYGQHIRNIGGSGAPGIEGNELNNWLEGSAGRNVLDGLGGNDVLVGGAGADSFVFGLRYDHDRVLDFRPGEDKVRMVSGARDWAEANARLYDSPEGVRISLADGSSLLLEGVAKAQLAERDFEFPMDMSRYVLTFHDEFNGPFRGFDGRGGAGGGGDGGTWRTQFPHNDGRYNAASDLQQYFKPGEVAGLETVGTSGGRLNLTAYHRPDLADAAGRSYASGMVSTEGTFAQKYGYFEAHMKLPAVPGSGLFSAFWLLPTFGSQRPIELDIMEQLGKEANGVYQMGHHETLDSSQWRTYGLEWTPERLAWYIDGKLTHTSLTHDASTAAYLVFNLSVGGGWAGRPSVTPPAGAEVGKVEVDWVRVWQRGDLLAAEAPATVAQGAPKVTFAGGNASASGDYASWLRFDYLADASGDLVFNHLSDINLKWMEDYWNGSGAGRERWLGLKTLNDRAADSYRAHADDGRKALNIRVVDEDGGRFDIGSFKHVGLVVGGTKDTTVALHRVQAADVTLGAGNDRVTITSPNTWDFAAGKAFNVATGAGNDYVAAPSVSGFQFRFDGGEGNDTLVGSTAADTLEGGAGDDRLTGSHGRDVFVFRQGQVGADTVTDFVSRDDVLRFHGLERSDLIIEATPAGAPTAGAVISWTDGGAGSVTLLGANVAQQSGWQFEFLA